MKRARKISLFRDNKRRNICGFVYLDTRRTYNNNTVKLLVYDKKKKCRVIKNINYQNYTEIPCQKRESLREAYIYDWNRDIKLPVTSNYDVHVANEDMNVICRENLKIGDIISISNDSIYKIGKDHNFVVALVIPTKINGSYRVKEFHFSGDKLTKTTDFSLQNYIGLIKYEFVFTWEVSNIINSYNARLFLQNFADYGYSGSTYKPGVRGKWKEWIDMIDYRIPWDKREESIADIFKEQIQVAVIVTMLTGYPMYKLCVSKSHRMIFEFLKYTTVLKNGGVVIPKYILANLKHDAHIEEYCISEDSLMTNSNFGIGDVEQEGEGENEEQEEQEDKKMKYDSFKYCVKSGTTIINKSIYSYDFDSCFPSIIVNFCDEEKNPTFALRMHSKCLRWVISEKRKAKGHRRAALKIILNAGGFGGFNYVFGMFPKNKLLGEKTVSFSNHLCKEIVRMGEEDLPGFCLLHANTDGIIFTIDHDINDPLKDIKKLVENENIKLKGGFDGYKYGLFFNKNCYILQKGKVFTNGDVIKGSVYVSKVTPSIILEFNYYMTKRIFEGIFMSKGTVSFNERNVMQEYSCFRDGFRNNKRVLTLEEMVFTKGIKNNNRRPRHVVVRLRMKHQIHYLKSYINSTKYNMVRDFFFNDWISTIRSNWKITS